ncbi:MAG: transcriptional regulator, partial [Desulfobulbales bacterium]
MIGLLCADELTLRDLSQALSIPEKDVMGHLPHLERSLRSRSGKLVEIPYKCLSCGFV